MCGQLARHMTTLRLGGGLAGLAATEGIGNMGGVDKQRRCDLSHKLQHERWERIAGGI